MTTSDSGGAKGYHTLHQGLAFSGKITASVSHELNNVISIIDQTTGLLEDMVLAVDRGKPISTDRLEQIYESLQKQTTRGLAIIKRLNTFAHSSDIPEREFDLGETIENLAGLCGRFADLKRMKLCYQPPPVVISVTGNPFVTQLVVFEGIREALDRGAREDEIVVKLEESDTGTCVLLDVPRGTIDQETWRKPEIQEFTDSLNADVEVTEVEDRVICRILVAGKS
jgi:signal transduction histidine kinase